MALSQDDLTRNGLHRAGPKLKALLSARGPIALDLTEVEGIDSAGVAALQGFIRQARAQGQAVSVAGAKPQVTQALTLFPYVEADIKAPRVRQNIFETIGEMGVMIVETARDWLLLCLEIVVYLARGVRRLHGLRREAILYEMATMGSGALGVVGLISLLVGATVALQSATQLRQFGANLFVADLIGVSITRELGPLMAAIVVAGRSGSAVAAEVATMVITEEVDALRTMGISPVQFIILPKVIAITITQPLLTVLANVLAIFGGFGVAILYLEVSPAAFLGRLQQALYLKDVGTGLFKAWVFAFLIVTIGALCGLRTRGGADAVGRSTTTSVVASIFAIVVADTVCSLLFYFGD